MNTDWSTEVPSTPGCYWMYREKSVKLVRVYQGSNNLFFVCEGHFLFKSELSDELWMRATIPDPPKT